MEEVTITEGVPITEEQIRALFRAMYRLRKERDVEKFKEQKKQYNVVAYAKRKEKQKRLQEEPPSI